MNEAEAQEFLNRARDEIAPSPAPIQQVIQTGQRLRRKRRLTQVGAVIAVAAIVFGGALLQPSSGDSEAPAAPPPGVANQAAGSPVAIATSSWKPGDASALMAFGGTLGINEENCLHLRGGGGPVDIIWPADYTAEQGADGTVVVKRPDGQVVAATGRSFEAGGGGAPAPSNMPCRAGTGEVLVVHALLPPLDSEATQMTSLECAGSNRVVGTWDFIGEEGQDTPEEAAAPYVDVSEGEQVRVESNDGREADVFILRVDGSARAVLNVRFSANTGWFVETFEACAGERLMPPT